MSSTTTPEKESSDHIADLVGAARRGSREAREELLVRSLPRFRQWARRRLPNAARSYMDTCDLAQEVALLTIARLAHFTPEHAGSMPAYVRRAAVNRVHDEVRRAARRPERVELAEDLPSKQASPQLLAIQAEERRRYRKAIGALRAKDRRILFSRINGEHSLATIARQFGLPSVAAAHMAVSRAERRLKRLLAY